MKRDDVEIIHLGHERQPLVIFENFAKNPKQLIEQAQTKSFTTGGRFYPGIRAPADFSYLYERGPLIKKIFTEVFNCKVGIKINESHYSLVTTPENQLQLAQSLPHFDGYNPQYFAVLHYLCEPHMGGTAFYRHKATGYETMSESRFWTYDKVLRDETNQTGIPSEYFRGGDHFEQIYKIEPVFNRLVIYRGILLHSGDIPTKPVLSDDPKTGRLTVNIFCSEA